MISTIDWNKTIVVLNQLDLIDLLLYTSVILNIVNISISLFQSRQITEIKKDYVKSNETTEKIRTNGQANRQDINRLFRMVNPDSNSIENLEQQVALINELLGSVMGASDLITGGLNSPADRVEEARERIKWEKERRKLNKPNESDFYEG